MIIIYSCRNYCSLFNFFSYTLVHHLKSFIISLYSYTHSFYSSLSFLYFLKGKHLQYNVSRESRYKVETFYEVSWQNYTHVTDISPTMTEHLPWYSATSLEQLSTIVRLSVHMRDILANQTANNPIKSLYHSC